jgi:hypothetical protein
MAGETPWKGVLSWSSRGACKNMNAWRSRDCYSLGFRKVISLKAVFCCCGGLSALVEVYCDLLRTGLPLNRSFMFHQSASS